MTNLAPENVPQLLQLETSLRIPQNDNTSDNLSPSGVVNANYRSVLNEIQRKKSAFNFYS